MRGAMTRSRHLCRPPASAGARLEPQLAAMAARVAAISSDLATAAGSGTLIAPLRARVRVRRNSLRPPGPSARGRLPRQPATALGATKGERLPCRRIASDEPQPAEWIQI